MSAVLAAESRPGSPVGQPDSSSPTATACMAGDGYCDEPATAYVFTTPGRISVVTGPSTAEMFVREPANARCADCAIADVNESLRHSTNAQEEAE